MAVLTVTIPQASRPNEVLPAQTITNAQADTLRFVHPRPQVNSSLTVILKATVAWTYRGKLGTNSFPVAANEAFRLRLEGRDGDSEDFAITGGGNGTMAIMIDGTY